MAPRPYTYGASPYESFAAFYRDAYRHAVREARPVGRLGAVLLATEQAPGNWSDAPSPDLVLAQVVQGVYHSRMDVGAGELADTFRPGHFVVVPPNTGTRFESDGHRRLRVVSVNYGRLLAFAGEGSGLPADGDFGPLHAGVRMSPPIDAALDALWTVGEGLEGPDALLADSVVLRIAALLLKLRGTGGTDRAAEVSSWRVARAVEFLQSHLADDLSLADLAAAAALSPLHFARTFRHVTGLTPHSYLLHARVRRAQDLLRGTSLPLAEVARTVGFASAAHLVHAFRAETGTTPGAYRRAVRG